MNLETDVRELLQAKSAEVGPLRTNPDTVVRMAHARVLRTGAIAAVAVVVLLVGGLAGANSLRGEQHGTPASQILGPCVSPRANSLAAKVEADTKVVKLGAEGSNLTALSLQLETTARDVHALAAAVQPADATDAALLARSADAYDAAGRAITDGLWGAWEGKLNLASRRLAEAERGIAESRTRSGTC